MQFKIHRELYKKICKISQANRITPTEALNQAIKGYIAQETAIKQALNYSQREE